MDEDDGSSAEEDCAPANKGGAATSAPAGARAVPKRAAAAVSEAKLVEAVKREAKRTKKVLDSDEDENGTASSLNAALKKREGPVPIA